MSTETTQVIEEQQAFVEWLKKEGIYNVMASAAMMQSMFEVWKRMKAENDKLRERVSDLAKRAGCPVCGTRGKRCMCDIFDGRS
jgi:hypothetical protein